VPGLFNVGAIRSTGLSASLGIAEYVADAVDGVPSGSRDPARRAPAAVSRWWERAARHR
jgi:glycerol-3-phosphate dehydrogenase